MHAIRFIAKLVVQIAAQREPVTQRRADVFCLTASRCCGVNAIVE
jgi:hypothetical protein